MASPLIDEGANTDSDLKLDPIHRDRYQLYRTLFNSKPLDHHDRRSTLNFTQGAKQYSRVYFEALHHLMLHESSHYHDLINHIASHRIHPSENAIEYNLWRRFYDHAIGQHDLDKPEEDHEWVNQVLSETKAWLRDNPQKTPNETWRHFAATDIIPFLEHGSPPNLNGEAEAYFCSSGHAVAGLIGSGAVLILNHQQPFNWSGQPIEDLFRNHIPAARLNEKHRVSVTSSRMDIIDKNGDITRQFPFRDKTLRQIRNKFLDKKVAPDQLWNVLDMQSWVPVPYPSFLDSPDQNLLLCLQQNQNTISERSIHFTLASQGGNHTASHVDDHGLGVFLTVQQGTLGIGWIPLSWQDRLRWQDDPISVKEKARYAVLRAEQTVFLPPGTIHYVFRKMDQPTLMTGGEVLPWPGLRKWLCILKHQELSEREPHIMAESSLAWAKSVLHVIKQRRQEDQHCAFLGGHQEANVIIATLERWESLKTMDKFFAFQGWDSSTL